jgi:hypothetical protein
MLIRLCGCRLAAAEVSARQARYPPICVSPGHDPGASSGASDLDDLGAWEEMIYSSAYRKDFLAATFFREGPVIEFAVQAGISPGT